MSQLFFILKVSIATIILVLIMQIRIGEGTIENHLYQYLTTASILQPIDGVAQGGASFIGATYKGVVKSLDSVLAKKFRFSSSQGYRELFSVKRSEKYNEDVDLKNQSRASYDEEDSD